MPSASYRHWITARAATLDDLESSYSAITGTGRARVIAAQHVTRAYAVLLCAEFQGFCRDLHDECIDFFSGSLAVPIRPLIRKSLRLNRGLDRGNPNPGNLGSDFSRFDFELWPSVIASDVRASAWQRSLEELNVWRNAIAHNDYEPTKLGFSTGDIILLKVSHVRVWRNACRHLAKAFDRSMRDHLGGITGTVPWT